MRIIRNPCVTRGEKDSIAREIARKLDVGPVLTRAMHVMAESGRFAIMPDFLSSLSRRIAASDGALVGDVVSASPLKPAQVKELVRALETRLHARVRLNSKVDTTLLAGLKITVAGRQYDGTLKGQVEQLRLRLRDIRKGA